MHTSANAVVDLAPAPEKILTTSFGELHVHGRAADFSPLAWSENYPPQWKSRAFYRVLEETMQDQFEFKYFALRDRQGATFAIQPVFFVCRDLIDEFPAPLRVLLNAIRSKRQTRILMAGSPVGESHLGGTANVDSAQARDALCEALNLYAAYCHVSLIVIKDLGVNYRTASEIFRRQGYTRLASFPAVKLELAFENFEDYLQRRLTGKMRRDLRLKFRKTANLGLELEVVSAVRPYGAEIHALYLEVVKRSAVEFDILTRRYFEKIGEALAPDAKFFIWRLSRRIIAFTFCVVTADTLYDMDVGLDYSVAHDLHLYFVTRRDMIEWAIARGLKTYICSPFGYDPKLHMKMDLVPLDLFVRHRSYLANLIIRRFGPRFAPARSEPILRQFPNYAEV